MSEPPDRAFPSAQASSGTPEPSSLIPCIHTIAEIQRTVAAARSAGNLIGLVPTMGALHEGHLSLVRRARSECGFVVVWIFVNPTQFGPHEDLKRYPRDIERDRLLSAQAGGDVIFNPTAAEIYPEGFTTWVEVEGLGEGLCGASRPGHFRGVCTVVTKFFNICAPDRAYFGQKDAQQLVVIRRMVRDLNMPVEVVSCPTVREPDGLAMSSRNAYLNPEERRQAVVLSQALRAVQQLVREGEREVATLKSAMTEIISSATLATLDYAEIVNVDDLQPMANVVGDCLAAVAVRFGRTRLIDNVVVRA